MAKQPLSREAVIGRHAKTLWRVFGAGAWKELTRPAKDRVRGQVAELLDAGVLADPADAVELDALREQAANAFADQTELTNLFFKDGVSGVDVVPSHAFAVAWVAAARELLGGAANYSQTPVSFSSVSMTVSAAGEAEEYILTVQRAEKPTPHELRQEAERALESAQQQLREQRARVEAVLGFHDAEGSCRECGGGEPCRTRRGLLGELGTEASLPASGAAAEPVTPAQ